MKDKPFCNTMNKYISKRAQNFQSSGIRKVFDLAANLKDPINFSIGQPDFSITEKVKQKIKDALDQSLTGYTQTQGILPLREKVSTHFKKNNIDKSPDEVIVVPGTSAGLYLALATIINPGDEIIVPDPYFVAYPEIIKFQDGIPVFLDTYPDFQINPTKLEKLITKKTKAILLNTPNNPTGAVYKKENLEKIAEIAKKHDLLIISDEIYELFVYDNLTHFSIGSIYPNTITIGGLSKTGGMPGLRLAWATGPKELVEKMKEIQQYTFVCAPSIIQYGALEAFEVNQQKINEYQKRRDLLFNILSKKYNIVKPQGAFYMFVEVASGAKFTEKAIRNNVLVVPANVFSQKDTHIRLSYAVSEETIQKGANILISH